MNYDPLSYSHGSRRFLTYGNRGMVATSSPLAAQAGLAILEKGGNAADAAVAAAAALTVTEPTSNGIGSDAFAIIGFRGKLYGINGSGPSPLGLSKDELTDKGGAAIPLRGWLPVTVPGAPATWAAIWKRFGALTFSELMAPAADYAENGFPVSPVISSFWKRACPAYLESWDSPLNEEWRRTFAPDGHGPEPGTLFKSKYMADTLRDIGETESDSFYRGRIASIIDAYSRKTGGYIRLADLEQFVPEWVEPAYAEYRGKKIWELPPNGQGVTALSALKIFASLDTVEFASPAFEHRLIESIKLAFADAGAYISDPARNDYDYARLLDDQYLKKRAALITDRAIAPAPGKPFSGGTVYLATADAHGNMVSFIQSNYTGFGSGLVIPGTGISMQNRGANFSLAPGHPNEYAPGKRPYHTIIPGFMTELDDTFAGPFGVMGGFMQPQGHVQLITAMLDGHLNPQDALDRPRWQWLKGLTVKAERGFPDDTLCALREMGHDIEISPSAFFGRGQVILRDKNGILCGASDKRADGCVAAR